MAERRTLIIIGVTIAIVFGLFAAWLKFAPNSSTVVSAANEIHDKAEIAKYVELSHVGIETSENYFGQKVRVIGGNLKNVSDKPIRMVALHMVFSDYNGKPILDTVQQGYPSALKPLPPGQQYRFNVGFDTLPREWNYHEPTVEIVKVGY